ncbi:MAG: hypothetical protein GX456_12860 [Verrucomicrobia bacterium]|nr:hypothetical protein [Verrucomicrobiota bacterium]
MTNEMLLFLWPAYFPARRSRNQCRLTGNVPRLLPLPDLQPRRAGKYGLRLCRKEERPDPNGFSRAAADAVRVGRHEAL